MNATSASKPPPAALLGLLFLSGLAFFALALATPGAGIALPSIVLEDGSSTTIANDTYVINEALGGAHAGQIFVANGSTLTLYNLSITFANTSGAGGIWVDGAATLVVDASRIGALSNATFGITVASSGILRLTGSNLTSIQIASDLAAPAILTRTGGEIHAFDSSLRAHPDLRPLLDADASTLEFTRCDLGGALVIVRSVATFSTVSLAALGDVTALETSGSTVTMENSSVTATGGASGISAADISDVTLRFTNITAEDLGVAAVRSSAVHMESVIVLDAAFGLVADSGVFTGSNIGVYGTTTSLWLRGSEATLDSALLGTGVIRLNASTATIGVPGTLLGLAVVESGSTLKLVDATFNWSKFAVGSYSWVVPMYTVRLRFFEPRGSGMAPDVNWSIFAPGGGLVARGVSAFDGTAQGPALEGPRFDGARYDQAPPYRVQFGRGTETFNSSTTAWGPSLVFDFYLDPSITDLAFEPEGLALSDAAPAVGSSLNASAQLSLLMGAGIQSVTVEMTLDGVPAGSQTVSVAPGGPTNITFLVPFDAGTHLLRFQVDVTGSGRGALAERSELANNFVAIWFNTTANTTVSVKPDLVVSDLWFEYRNTTVRDSVTGEALSARYLVIHVNITNAGLTAAGAFDMSVAAGVNTSRVRLAGVAAGATLQTNVTFGPYSRNEVIPIRAQVDVDDRVPEGDETNNVGDGSAAIVIPPLPRPERPLWATVLVIAAAVGIVGLSLLGVRGVFKAESDDSIAASDSFGPASPPSTTTMSAAPAEPSGVAPLPASGAAPPPPQPAPTAPTTYGAAAPPTYGAYGPPPSYPQAAYYAPAYSMPPPSGPQSGSQPAPPARCPRCGSPQVSYVLYPVRQVVCTACKAATLF